MNRQVKTKRSGQKKSDYYVTWFEVAQTSGVVYATSPAEAIDIAKRKLTLDENHEEEYFGEPHLDSFECTSRSDDRDFAGDYVQLLLRTLQRNLGKRLSSEIHNRSEQQVSEKGESR